VFDDGPQPSRARLRGVRLLRHGRPWYATDDTIHHLGLRDTDRITERRYEAGHMMHVHRPSRERLPADLKLFLNRNL
jgi:carboxypeptidase C (cathepsin A)